MGGLREYVGGLPALSNGTHNGTTSRQSPLHGWAQLDIGGN